VAVKNGARTIGAGHFSRERFLGTVPSTIRALMPRVKLTLSATQSMRASLINLARRAAVARLPYSCWGFGEARNEKGAWIKSPLYAPCIDKCALHNTLTQRKTHKTSSGCFSLRCAPLSGQPSVRRERLLLLAHPTALMLKLLM
jgi:hypothetical protein